MLTPSKSEWTQALYRQMNWYDQPSSKQPIRHGCISKVLAAYDAIGRVHSTGDFNKMSVCIMI